jgi:hypothetical protein
MLPSFTDAAPLIVTVGATSLTVTATVLVSNVPASSAAVALIV